MPANGQSTFLKRYQQCFVDSASCRNHINMSVEGSAKGFVNFRQDCFSLLSFAWFGLTVSALLSFFIICFVFVHLPESKSRKKRKNGTNTSPLTVGIENHPTLFPRKQENEFR